MTKRIKKLLVVALKPEWTHLRSGLDFHKEQTGIQLYSMPNHDGCALLQTGNGMKNAGKSLSKFFQNYTCESVLHFGSSGSLLTGREVGDVCIALHITGGKETISIRSKYLGSLQSYIRKLDQPFFEGTLLTSDHVLKNRQEKDEAANSFGAVAVDMESFAIAKMCEQQNVDYLSVRGIFDRLEDNIEALGEPYDDQGNLKAGALAANLVKSPKLILSVPELKKRSDLVNRNLGKIVMWYLASASSH